MWKKVLKGFGLFILVILVLFLIYYIRNFVIISKLEKDLR